MSLERVPKTNSFGLVLPPSQKKIKYLKLFFDPDAKPDSAETHHKYWPWTLYSSDLARDFREHPSNMVWILHSHHRSLHHQFDGVPVPPDEVMHTYLDEAYLLDSLEICIRGLRDVNNSFYEGHVRHPRAVEEHCQEKLETIKLRVEQVNEFTVFPIQIARFAGQQLVEQAHKFEALPSQITRIAVRQLAELPIAV